MSMEPRHIRILTEGSDESMPYGNDYVFYDTQIPLF